ncbi:MAG: type II secretion system protein M [Bacillus sp. (in: Bacteria)]|nr:type II secretion system protein M [Bacillus sp. (in: firmicutes)]
MKLHFSKRDKFIVGFGALLLVLLVIYAQFFILSPLKTAKEIKQQSLKTEQKLLEIVSQNNGDITGNNTEDTSLLQKQVPVQPLQEQFILDLEKAENVSNSRISSMGFSKDGEVAVVGEPATPEASNTEQTKTPDTNAAEAQTTDNQPAAPVTPTGMKKLTVSLSVESPTYKELEKFIETLEALTRIVVVESINYSGGPEITSLDQENLPLSYSLTISAYYMPELADLQPQLPKIDTPLPANKENPLSQFSNLTEGN